MAKLKGGLAAYMAAKRSGSGKKAAPPAKGKAKGKFPAFLKKKGK